MFNQWDFVNQGFNGTTLFYRSETCAGILHIVSSFPYLNLGIDPNGGGLQMGQSNTGGAFITGSPSSTGGLDSTAYSSGLISVSCTQNTNFTAGGIPANTGPMNFGITCLQNTPQLQAGGTCYAFQADSVNFANFYRLVKMTAGPDNSLGSSLGSSYILLGTTPSNAWTLGTLHQMSLFWFQDPYFLKGVWLVAFLGTTQIFNIVHTGPDAILTSPHGQGIYCQGSSNGSAVTWYSTSLQRYQVLSVNNVSYPPT